MEQEIIKDCKTCKHYMQHYILDENLKIFQAGCWHCKKRSNKNRSIITSCPFYEYENKQIIETPELIFLRRFETLDSTIKSWQRSVKTLINRMKKKH